jgi:chemotaxis family two-component system response regulator Rcp1
MMATELCVKPIEILLVEDNPGDAELVLDFLEQSKVRNTINWVKDGDEAMGFLHNLGEYADKPLPDLILLDLNLPGKDGREVLAEVKADQRLRHIPVVVLTSSKAEADIAGSYNLNANAFVTKPVNLEQFVRVIRTIDEFWLSVVRLPTSGGEARA